MAPIRKLGKETWDKLNAELYTSNPYFDSNFIEPILAYFTTGEERLCIHRQGADIDGLVIVNLSPPAKWSIFKSSQSQITPLILRYPENLQNLFFFAWFFIRFGYPLPGSII